MGGLRDSQGFPSQGNEGVRQDIVLEQSAIKQQKNTSIIYQMNGSRKLAIIKKLFFGVIKDLLRIK